jgi:hypothetical protein
VCILYITVYTQLITVITSSDVDDVITVINGVNEESNHFGRIY